MSDPRIFFASERTLLAWIRSGLTAVALGLVLARFRMILTMMPSERAFPSNIPAIDGIISLLGMILVVGGAIAVLGAVVNHRSFVKSLPKDDIPIVGFPWLTEFFALVVAAVGVLLAAYLVFT